MGIKKEKGRILWIENLWGAGMSKSKKSKVKKITEQEYAEYLEKLRQASN